MSGDRSARPEPALFPAAGDREAIEDMLTRTLAAALRALPNEPVTPSLDHDAFRAELAEYDFEQPRPLPTSLDWAVRQMRHGLVHVNHPRYFGLFNPAPCFPSECADRIAAAFNPQLATRSTSPVAVLIEDHVVRAIGRRTGFVAPVAGHFTTGGSEANYTALICALTRAEPAFAAVGARGFAGQPVFYVSRECHLAWVKIAHQAGIGRQAVRFVATDGGGRLDADALRGLIAADVAAGTVPVMVVATAGTTNAGMIDPLAACARIAVEAGLWFHVDAAWGGAAIASPSRRRLLAGIERADSVTIDAHKWLSTTMGCGMFITPHASILSTAFHVAADFMPSADSGADPYVASAQWSRRFVGLRLFLALASAGWSGYGRLVDTAVALSEYLEESLAAKGWTIANRSSLAVVCAEPTSGSAAPRVIVDRLVASGLAWCSLARFESREVVRLCISNGTSARQDVDALVDGLEQARVFS